MPPIIINPPSNGSTNGTSYYFNQTNAHGTHSETAVARWKLTVTTLPDNGGTLKTQTAWSYGPIATCQVNNLPANNAYYYGQIVYEKPTGGTWTSMSNRFQSRR